MELQGVTRVSWSYRVLRGGYRWFTGGNKGYRALQGVTRVTGGYKGLLGVTRSSRGLQGVTGITVPDVNK